MRVGSQSPGHRSAEQVLREAPPAAAVNGAHANGHRPVYALSVIVPTKNEADNVAELVRRIGAVPLPGPVEIIFVDDSDDGTPTAVRSLQRDRAGDIVLLHRPSGQRAGGLGGAVVEGLERARAPWAAVIDADLQHPPELLEDLLKRTSNDDCDVVIASRYRVAQQPSGFSRLRALLSHASTTLAKIAFPARLRGVTDPMSGFFLVRRDAVAPKALRPRGFKILLDILVRTPDLRVAEVPFSFGKRHAGKSKASVHEALLYLSLLTGLRFGDGSWRIGRFVTVGLTGLAVNTAFLAIFTELAGVHYLLSAVLATQASTAWNFALTEAWVFRHREHGRSAFVRLASFWLMNNMALWLRGPALWLLTSQFGIHYLASNLITLGGFTVLRFAFADTWIWASAVTRTQRVRLHSYDIHGIISVASDAGLPELEKFRVPALLGEPDIRLRIGKVPQQEADTPESAQRICYDEGLGPFGFGMSIEIGERIEVIATPLLRRSPHVLYTNIVEPILRWQFADRGYALVHGACLAIRDRAFLITARTDTGKTTTILKTLDARPWSFLSDDLTLLRPDGKVLMYPKPMTISRHTVHAVKTPRLNRWERFTLIFQSRLHSRSGRIFAMIIARTHLPVATVNTVVQLLVPPPKYHVERLIPGAHIAREGQLDGMVIIQRGGDGNVALSEGEALEILLENCEDAYGFPPYHTIEHFLHSRNGSDLRARERSVIASALHGKPTTLVRSTTMNWAERLPAIISPDEVPVRVPARALVHAEDAEATRIGLPVADAAPD